MVIVFIPDSWRKVADVNGTSVQVISSKNNKILYLLEITIGHCQSEN